MTKQEFLLKLRQGLSDFPEKEINEYIEYYSEMIDDRMEEGLCEEAAVADIGTPEEIISKIISETPLPNLIKTKFRKKHTLSGWEILLIALAFPIWFPLLMAVLSVIFSVLMSLLAVIISLYSVAIAFAACAVLAPFASITMFISGNYFGGCSALGIGLICAGGAILMFIGLNRAIKATAGLIKRFIIWLKTRFITKEKRK